MKNLKFLSVSDEFDSALWYIVGQLQKISHNIGDVVTHFVLEESFKSLSEKETEASMTSGLKVYSKAEEEIIKCQKNINKTLVSIRAFLSKYQKQENVTLLNENRLVFDEIENWTENIEKQSRIYKRAQANCKSTLPSIKNLCNKYDESITELNSILEIICLNRKMRLLNI